VGYVGGKTNPLNKISFYNFKDGKIISENKVRNSSMLINQKHQEYFYRIYCNNMEDKDMILQSLSLEPIGSPVENNSPTELEI
jgi:hypothetical protein